MALEEVINEGNSSQVLVDIPVVVERHEGGMEAPPENNPRKRKIIQIVVVVALIALVIGEIVLFKKADTRPDLEIKAPEGSKAITPIFTPTPTLTDQLSQTPYINSVEGYQISPPMGWVIDDSKKESNAVLFVSPVAKVVENRRLSTFISVETSAVKDVQLLDQVREIKEGLQETFPDFLFEEDILLYLDARQHYLISGTYSLNDIQMRTVGLITIYNNIGYAVSATGPALNWGDFEKVITASIYSFRVL